MQGAGKLLEWPIAIRDPQASNVLNRFVLQFAARAAVKNGIAEGNILGTIERFENAVNKIDGERRIQGPEVVDSQTHESWPDAYAIRKSRDRKVAECDGREIDGSRSWRVELHIAVLDLESVADARGVVTAFGI